MLDAMRKQAAKIVTGILFALLIMSFVVWGIGDIFRGPGVDTTVIEVEDREFSQIEFLRNYQQQVNLFSRQLGRSIDFETAQSMGIVDRVVNDMVNQAVFAKRAEDLSISVTKQQLTERLANDPNYRGPDGSFDPALLRQALRSSGYTEQAFLAALRDEMRRRQILDAAAAPADPPEFLTQRIFEYDNEKRVGRYVLVPLTSVADVGEPSVSDLREYYEANQDQFMAPEYRAATMIILQPEDIIDEVRVSEDDLRAEYEARKDEFDVAEQRQITQIVLPDQETAQQAADLTREGLTLQAVSDQLGTGQPVELGMMTRDDLPAALADAAFALESGEVSGPVESSLGWHILQVGEIEAGEESTFEGAREELERDMKLRLAVDSLVSITNQLDDELAGGASLEEAAGALNLELTRIEAMDRFGRNRDREVIEALQPRGPIVQEVFQSEPGSAGLIQETDNNGYFVVRVDSVTPEAVRPFEEVRDRVTARWRTAEQRARAQERAEEIEQALAAGESLEEAASDFGYQVRATEPVLRTAREREDVPSPQFTSTLFDLKLGESAIVESPGGPLVMTLSDIRPAEGAAEDFEAVRTELDSAFESDLLQQFVMALREGLSVSVDRNGLRRATSELY